MEDGEWKMVDGRRKMVDGCLPHSRRRLISQAIRNVNLTEWI